jgi:hypothetical protein
MDFYTLEQTEPGYTLNPFAAKIENEWIPGEVSIEFLNTNFGQYTTAQEMIDATESEGLKLFFSWLKDQGKLK